MAAKSARQDPAVAHRAAHHLPGLNGLRAIAALAVVCSHLIVSFRQFGLDPYVLGKDPDGTARTTALAGFGVSLFFALSGFLITHLLLLERSATGRVSIRDFYVRRVLRIWPLYYAYLAIALTYTVLTTSAPLRSAFFYVLLLANIPFVLNATLPFLAHYWSLGVEEQFYVLWPWVVAKTRNLKRFCLVGIAFLLALKTTARFGLGDTSVAYRLIHVTRFHCMLIGGLGAVLVAERQSPLVALASRRIAQVLAWAVIGLAAVNHFHIASFLDNEIISGVTVVLIIGQILPRRPILSLEKPLFDFIGQISYGIYVIHPLVIESCARLLRGHLVGPPVLQYAVVFAVVFSATIGAAFISYAGLETPFLRMKRRFSAIPSSGTRIAFLESPSGAASVSQTPDEPIVPAERSGHE